MKKALLISLVTGSMISILGGCGAQREINEPDILPRLREYHPIVSSLPGMIKNEYHVMVQVNIDEEGNVARAFLQQSTGLKELDDSIITSVRQWKFYPAEIHGQPVALLVAQQLTIRFEPPVQYTMAEIVVPRSTLADTVTQEISKGVEFEELARRLSTSNTAIMGGYLGQVELKNFRPDIYTVIKKLLPGEVSNPQLIDHSYVIYKRLK
jgi:TonB family protein